MTRSEVREHIFRLVFRLEFNEAEDMPLQLERYFEDTDKEDLDSDTPEDAEKICLFSEDDERYIRDKYDNIRGNLTGLDEVINSNAKGWDTGRMGKVDLAILRLAVYEMKYDEKIPVGVAIDEAVELAKKYGQDESPSFINGILASVAKSV
ncbi:MAG: transcription antitermination factor NusB [Lachnospiraceae bacterium]|nr:transcription antitermination factor NusB [Lachnospiraceae bacterium]